MRSSIASVAIVWLGAGRWIGHGEIGSLRRLRAHSRV
jgi:hypothetical protein